MSLATPGTGSVWPQGHNLNKLGRGPLGNATYQISRIEALRFQTRRFFHVFPKIGLCKKCDPGAGHIWPPGYNLNKLGRSLLGDATYQISKL